MWSTGSRPWDPIWFRENRNRWRSIRDFAHVGVEEIAKRAGVSASSVTRYEQLTRSPDPAVLGQLRTTYTAILEERTTEIENSLALISYTQWYAQQHESDASEDIIDYDEVIQWLAGDGDTSIADYSIDHITELAHVRSLMPRPDYRVPTPENFWLVGFAGDTPEDDEAAA